MKIEIYGATWCKPCRDTKKFLTDKNYEFTFYDIDEDGYREEYQKRTGKVMDSIPQVFINDEHIGGRDDLIRKLS